MRKRMRTEKELLQFMERKARKGRKDYKELLYDAYMLGNYDRIQLNWLNEKQ